MKIKHSKYKNAGIIFELLTRQITSDTLSGSSTKALSLLQKHFNSKSEILKEYKIYHTLSSKKYESESNATILIDTLIEAHSKLNKTQIRKEKYNLIKEIKSTYDINDFFKAKISNYKVMASIFNLIENKDAKPLSIVSSKVTLVEHITAPSVDDKPRTIVEDYSKEDKHTRLLAYKILLNKFNEKYKGLGENQQSLLEKYVTNVTNSPALKSYINQEISKLEQTLTELSTKVSDRTVEIKINEVKGLIQPLDKQTSVKDDHVINLLNYYELVNELKSLHA